MTGNSCGDGGGNPHEGTTESFGGGVPETLDVRKPTRKEASALISDIKMEGRHFEDRGASGGGKVGGKNHLRHPAHLGNFGGSFERAF